MNTQKQIIRFLIVGVFVTITDISVYYALIHTLTFSLSKAISFTCAGIVGYLLNKYWTFNKTRSSYAEIGRYVIINSLALGINVFINQSMLAVWPGVVWLALVVATALTSLFIFVCFKWWVFR